MKKCVFLLAIFCSVFFVHADKIWLSDGSVLVGQLKKMHDGKAILVTEFAGELTIDQSLIVNLESSLPLHGVLENNQRLSGTIASGTAGQVKVDSMPAAIALNNIKALWATGEADPTIPPPPPGRVWSGEASLDIAGKTGNTEKFTGGAGVKGILTGQDDRLMLYARGVYARENGVENEKEYRLGADYEHMIANTNNSWFVKGEILKDEFAGFKFRGHLVAGYGYFFFKEADTELRLRIGASYKRTEYEDGYSDNAYGADISLHYERQIDEWGRLISDLVYTPSFDDWDDYRLYHESALDIPLLMSKPISLRLGVSNEYNNKVATGVERLDTTYFAKLVYKWK